MSSIKIDNDTTVIDSYESLVLQWCDNNDIDINNITHGQFGAALRYTGKILFSDRSKLKIDVTGEPDNNNYNKAIYNYDLIYDIFIILYDLCVKYKLVFQDFYLSDLLMVNSDFIWNLQFEDGKRCKNNINGVGLYREIKKKSAEALKTRMLDDNTYAPKFQYMLNSEFGYDKTYEREVIAQLGISKTNPGDLLSKYNTPELELKDNNTT